MDLGAGQEIYVFNTSSHGLMEMIPGTCFDNMVPGTLWGLRFQGALKV